MDWIQWLGGSSGIAALIIAISTFRNLRSQNKLQQQKQFADQQNRMQELEALEHKMVMDLSSKYQNLIIPLEARIKTLEAQVEKYKEELEQHKEELEQAEAENRQLKQTNYMYEERIKFLEDTLETLNVKYMNETAKLRKQLMSQNRKLKKLEEAIEE